MLKLSRRARRLAAQHVENFRAWCEHHEAPHFQFAEEVYRPFRPCLCLIRATPIWLDWLHNQSASKHGHLKPFLDGLEDHRPLAAIDAGEVETAVAAWRSRKGFAGIRIVWHVLGQVSLLEVYFMLDDPKRGRLCSLVFWFERLALLLLSPFFSGRPRPSSVRRWLRYDGVL